MLAKSLRNSYNYLFFLLIPFAISCNKAEVRSYTPIKNPSEASINKVISENGKTYAIGGDSWTYGMILEYHSGSFEIIAESDKELLQIKYINDKIIAVGLNGHLFEITDKVRFYQHSQGQVARDLIEKEGNLLIAGGKSYGIGYISTLSPTYDVLNTIDYPYELRAMERIGKNIIASGFGIVLRSNDNGDSWDKLDQEGDFYLSIAKNNNNHCYIVGQEGKIIKSIDSGETWQSLKAPKRVQINSARIIRDELYVWCDKGIIQIFNPNEEEWRLYDIGDHDLNDGIEINDQLLIVGEDGFAGVIDF